MTTTTPQTAPTALDHAQAAVAASIELATLRGRPDVARALAALPPVTTRRRAQTAAATVADLIQRARGTHLAHLGTLRSCLADAQHGITSLAEDGARQVAAVIPMHRAGVGHARLITEPYPDDRVRAGDVVHVVSLDNGLAVLRRADGTNAPAVTQFWLASCSRPTDAPAVDVAASSWDQLALDVATPA